MRAAITGYRGFIGKRLLSTCELSIGIGEGYTKEELYRSLNDFRPNVVFHIGACNIKYRCKLYVREKLYKHKVDSRLVLW